ncbi:MAG: arsenate reductase family protein [Collinsella sp.]
MALLNDKPGAVPSRKSPRPRRESRRRLSTCSASTSTINRDARGRLHATGTTCLAPCRVRQAAQDAEELATMRCIGKNHGLIAFISSGTARRHRPPEADRCGRTNFIPAGKNWRDMNIQILADGKKVFWHQEVLRHKKAQRYFKERRIKVQFIDLKEKEMSKGELTSVMQAVGGIDKLLNPKAKDEETLALIQHLPLASASTSCSRTSRF